MLPTLRTERLVLRPLVEGDAEAMHIAMSDVDLMHWWSSAPHRTLERTREYVAANAAEGAWLTWAITEDGGEALGWVVLGEHREGIRELGYILRRDRWGRGYAHEAASAVLDHAFGAMKLRRVFADVDPENAASVGLLKRLGFRQEGHLRAEWETHIGIRDSLIFGLLRDEWR
ncbi:GNAT family N-acetyltransferase [Sphingomonas sp. LaA6.9]|uniref:GNAT family N-acetyltransferase n=1 Tax=Sphingomonas sp. LaA6.9 TaxID=2919914 RepID=UPI001F4F8E4C|nr:GNAT family N-acetyltransferase [Sphingomonas sp. LaA6.9]MCJ8155806.1 GNAT family N-acetyltransferase [Sphingomonas sp. LaA6.9]